MIDIYKEFEQERKQNEPLYKWVKRGLTRLLGLGELKPAQAIPTEKALAEQFQVSVGTIRKAIDELVQEEVLIRHQGRGTFVSAHDRSRYLFRFFNLCRHDGVRTYPEVHLLSFTTVKALRDIAKKLQVSPGTRLYYFKNCLQLDGVPVLLDEIWLSAQRFPHLHKEDLQLRRSTLYQLYEEKFAISITRIEEHIRACCADADKAQLLRIDVGSALLHIIRYAYTVDDKIVEVRHSFVRTDQYEYFRKTTDMA